MTRRKLHPNPGLPRFIPPAADMVGKQFGWLTVISREGSWRSGGVKKGALWRCVCTCGQQVVVVGAKLRRGSRKACARNGHFWAAQSRGGLTIKFESEYNSWSKMWERCIYKKHPRYKQYGGRGIKVCARWKKFAAFLEDMKPKPGPGYTIERNDVNGNYELGNCRWATWAEQYRNMRRSVYVEYEGERMLLMDLCDKLGLSRGIVYGRLKNGWPLGDAILTPVNKYKKHPSKLKAKPK